MVWLTDGEKSDDMLAVSTQYRCVTDGQTEEQTSSELREHVPRCVYAWRDKCVGTIDLCKTAHAFRGILSYVDTALR